MTQAIKKTLKISHGGKGESFSLAMEFSPANYKFTIESFFENENGLNYKFNAGADPSLQFHSTPPKNIKDIKSLYDGLDGIYKKDEKAFECFIWIKALGYGTLEIFMQRVEPSRGSFAVEIQCKLHFSNGHKNDQVIYINHLIPLQPDQQPDQQPPNNPPATDQQPPNNPL